MSGIAGTGLGLAIAHDIVERHMGSLEVHSEGIEGEGAEFDRMASLTPPFQAQLINKVITDETL